MRAGSRADRAGSRETNMAFAEGTLPAAAPGARFVPGRTSKDLPGREESRSFRFRSVREAAAPARFPLQTKGFALASADCPACAALSTRRRGGRLRAFQSAGLRVRVRPRFRIAHG